MFSASKALIFGGFRVFMDIPKDNSIRYIVSVERADLNAGAIKIIDKLTNDLSEEETRIMFPN